ncbi:hypothetical protein [Bacillus toyonensis]|uniref:hypothetical protein n=1 Tax=Bacillus toyonensis TaxID=155322 RepID=UPI002E1D8502|nr:hypothetical protein [Bacillus toyonensis]
MEREIVIFPKEEVYSMGLDSYNGQAGATLILLFEGYTVEEIRSISNDDLKDPKFTSNKELFQLLDAAGKEEEWVDTEDDKVIQLPLSKDGFVFREGEGHQISIDTFNKRVEDELKANGYFEVGAQDIIESGKYYRKSN